MRRLICRVLGHRLPELLRLRETEYRGTDALRREHYAVLQCCARCRERFVVAHVATEDTGKPGKTVW